MLIQIRFLVIIERSCGHSTGELKNVENGFESVHWEATVELTDEFRIMNRRIEKPRDESTHSFTILIKPCLIGLERIQSVRNIDFRINKSDLTPSPGCSPRSAITKSQISL